MRGADQALNEPRAATRIVSRRCAFSFINELGELPTALGAAERVLKPNGRLVIVSFHSLEASIVKIFMVERSRAAAGSSPGPE